MVRGSSSFRNLIALVCIMQCFMNPVSSIQCIQCLANEDGVCIEPSEPEDYKVECAVAMEKNIQDNREQLKALFPNVDFSEILHKLPKEYVCTTTKAKVKGLNIVAKACGVKNCDFTRAGFTYQGFEVQSCEPCNSDYCNSANISYTKFSYLLIALAFIYYAVY